MRFLSAALTFAALSLSVMSSSAATNGKYFLYVGSYSDAIQGYEFDPSSGQLKSIGAVGQIQNPSWVGADSDHKHLYAVSELDNKTGGVGAFAINAQDGSLKKLNEVSSYGDAPCHLAVDHTNKMIIVANYMTGGVSAYPLKDDGSIGELASLMTAIGHGPNKDRQDGPHAHEVVISKDNKLAYVPDLGQDEIRIYMIDPKTGRMGPHVPAFIKQDAGFGPRHLAFSADERYAYLVNELHSVVSVFEHNSSTGEMKKIQDISTLPPNTSGFNGPAEVLIDKAGKHLYATNRGHDSIAVFSIGADGKLAHIQDISAEGKMPRGFVLDPTGKYAFVGNQKTDNFVVYSVGNDGKLKPTGTVIHTPSPVSFEFVAQS